MAFKRTNFNRLAKKTGEFFNSTHSFSKVADFKIGSEVYVIPLGLETGYYEVPCHAVYPHKVNGQTIGYGGTTFRTFIKCNGIDEEGNKQPSLCCDLAQKFKEKYPNQEDYAKRIIGGCSYRVILPVLILGNSLKEQKLAYPISKVSITNELTTEKGLKFAYIEMSSATFRDSIVKPYGKKLKEEGILDYEAEEDEEYFDDLRKRLSETIIKVSGVSKEGFGSATMKEYSFFPFSNAAIAAQSPAGEREAIVGYKNHREIMNKITEFLTLLDVEVDNIFKNWDEKSLTEYYNSAMGLDLKAGTPKTNSEPEEKIEMADEHISKAGEAELDSELSKLDEEEAKISEPATNDIDFQYNEEEEGDFFGEQD